MFRPPIGSKSLILTKILVQLLQPLYFVIANNTNYNYPGGHINPGIDIAFKHNATDHGKNHKRDGHNKVWQRPGITKYYGNNLHRSIKKAVEQNDLAYECF